MKAKTKSPIAFLIVTIVIWVFAFLSDASFGIPANPRPFDAKQPDGTKIRLRANKFKTAVLHATAPVYTGSYRSENPLISRGAE